MIKLVLIRHGQSLWNLENKFTGWTDVELSEKGIKEAKEAGKVLKEQGFHFDLAFTSVLKRAEDTLDYILKEMGEEDIKIKRSWKLNERHYGALQGLNKDETKEKYGGNHRTCSHRITVCKPYSVVFFCSIIKAPDWLTALGNSNTNRHKHLIYF